MSNEKLTPEEKKEFKQLLNLKHSNLILEDLSEKGKRQLKFAYKAGSIDTSFKAFDKEDRDLLKTLNPNELRVIVRYWIFNSGNF